MFQVSQCKDQDCRSGSNNTKVTVPTTSGPIMDGIVQRLQALREAMHTSDVTSGLKLGTISEIWETKEEWNKFTKYLDEDNDPEDVDGQGNPLKLTRYAR